MVIRQASPKLTILVYLTLYLCASGAGERQAEAYTQQLAGAPAVAGDAAASDPVLPAEDVDVSVGIDGIVEMHIQDGDLYVVLQQLLLKSRRNIIFGNGVGGTVTVSLYNVSVDEALDAILKPNGFAYRKEGNFTYVYTQEEMARIEEDERVPVTRTFRLNYISPADAKAFISGLLSPNEGKITIGPVASGGLSSGSSTTTGMRSLAIEDIIMVHDYEDRLREIEKTLAELDKRPKQVLVEATILRVSLTESNALGIDFNVLGGVDFKMLAAADGRTGLIPNSANSASSLGQGQIGTGTGASGSLAGGLSLGSNAANIGTLNNQVPISKLDDLSIGIGTDFAGNVPTGGISFGLVTDRVSMFIRALESVSDVVVIGNPKVLALNKQEAHVLVGSRDGFLTTQITTQTATTQSIDYLETGTQLRFTPFISNDGFVRMRVTPSDSTGGVDGRGLPFERTAEVTTDIMVKDGHTILIGGLFREVSTVGRSQIPGLGSLPLVGAAFSSNSDSTVREEVIILLTVHIVDDESEYAEYTQEVLNDMERQRVGIRESMMFFGRERLAQANFQSALEYANLGEWDLADWHTKLAIHNRPTFAEAHKLREKIHHKRRWDHDGTVTRNFIRNLILRKQGLPEELYGIPPLPERPVESETEEQSSKPPKKDRSRRVVIRVGAPAEPDSCDSDLDFCDDEPDWLWDEVPYAPFEGPEALEGPPYVEADPSEEVCEDDTLSPEEQDCEGDDE